MKKLLLTLMLFFASIGACLASNWVTIEQNGYLDIESLKFDDQYVYGWIKQLNPEGLSPVNKDKVQEAFIYYVVDCYNKKIKAISAVEYGKNGKVLASFDISSNYNPRYIYNNWQAIVPDSRGESYYKAFSKCREIYYHN